MTQRSTRSALVCGSDGELAAAIALHLSAQKIGVALLVTAAADADVLAERTGLPVFSWDVGDYDACDAGIRDVQKRLGPLDILVNGAEVQHECATAELTQPMWRNVIKVNIGGCFNLVKAVFPGMCERRFGRVITIAVTEEAAVSLANRTAAAAVRGFTRALAYEGRAAGVTANLIAHHRSADQDIPGWRQDMANAVALLCADGSSGITGSTLVLSR